MKYQDFDKLPEIALEEFFNKNWNIGDKFLLGESMVEQKHKKGLGDSICYYEITYADEHKSASYIQKFDKLE